MKDKLDKYKGCFLGLAIGDVLGMPFEFRKRNDVEEYLSKNNLEIKEFNFRGVNFPAGFYTDDTAMTICLAESLIAKGFDLKDQFDRYYNWYRNGYATPFDNCCYGVGNQTQKALHRPLPQEQWDGKDESAGGNGSLMRCAPVGLYYQGDYGEIKEKSHLSSFLTHNYYIAGWTCVILNALISLIIEGKEKEILFSEIAKFYEKEMPKEILDLLQTDYKIIEWYNGNISGYSLDTLRIALWAFMISDNFADGIKKVILLGDDTDTFGAVAGALLGAYYGYNKIPENWKGKVIKENYILKLAEDIYNKTVCGAAG